MKYPLPAMSAKEKQAPFLGQKDPFDKAIEEQPPRCNLCVNQPVFSLVDRRGYLKILSSPFFVH